MEKVSRIEIERQAGKLEASLRKEADALSQRELLEAADFPRLKRMLGMLFSSYEDGNFDAVERFASRAIKILNWYIKNDCAEWIPELGVIEHSQELINLINKYKKQLF